MINQNFLKAKILLAELTINDLAQKTGISEYTLKRIIANSYQPSTEMARKIARALNLSNDEIIKVFFSEFKKLTFEQVLEKDKKKSRLR